MQAVADLLNLCGIPDKSGQIGFVDILHPGRADHRQTGAVGRVVLAADFTLNAMTRTVLDAADADRVVMGDSASPHNLRPGIVVGGLPQSDGAEPDQRAQYAFAQLVSEITVRHRGKVPFLRMHDDICDAV